MPAWHPLLCLSIGSNWVKHLYKVVVVGGGDVAIDVAREALRQGAFDEGRKKHSDRRSGTGRSAETHQILAAQGDGL